MTELILYMYSNRNRRIPAPFIEQMASESVFRSDLITRNMV